MNKQMLVYTTYILYFSQNVSIYCSYIQSILESMIIFAHFFTIAGVQRRSQCQGWQGRQRPMAGLRELRCFLSVMFQSLKNHNMLELFFWLFFHQSFQSFQRRIGFSCEAWKTFSQNHPIKEEDESPERPERPERPFTWCLGEVFFLH